MISIHAPTSLKKHKLNPFMLSCYQKEFDMLGPTFSRFKFWKSQLLTHFPHFTSKSPTNPTSPNFGWRNPSPGFMGLVGWEGFVGYPMPNPEETRIKCDHINFQVHVHSPPSPAGDSQGRVPNRDPRHLDHLPARIHPKSGPDKALQGRGHLGVHHR